MYQTVKLLKLSGVIPQKVEREKKKGEKRGCILPHRSNNPPARYPLTGPSRSFPTHTTWDPRPLHSRPRKADP